MTIDSMRVGGGRCPPLLVGGLLIACIMMLCNWWTLSSTNLELLRQIDELNEQIKISVEERDQCVTQRGIYEKQLKSCQDDSRTANVKLSQVDDNLSTCNQELKSFKDIDLSKTATLEILRVDKNAVAAQLKTTQEENKKLEEELNNVKDELEKVKLTVNAPVQKQTPAITIARLQEKTQSDNKTASNSAPQVNAPPNAVNGEPIGQDFQEKENNSNVRDDNNAAEVNDGNNAVDSDLNLNLMSDGKLRETRK